MADNPVITPKRFSHVGFQTYDVARLRDWYCLVLGARVVFEKPGGFCVIAYDDEHHRVAIAGLPGKPRRKFAANPEIVHTAYAYADIFAAAIGGKTETKIIPGAGHLAELDKPAEVAKAILDFTA